jgi:hypothetical protein
LAVGELQDGCGDGNCPDRHKAGDPDPSVLFDAFAEEHPVVGAAETQPGGPKDAGDDRQEPKHWARVIGHPP